MRSILTILVAVCMITQSWSASRDIRLNSLGFLPNMPKKASITAESDTFRIKDALSGETIFIDTVSGPHYQEDIDQTVWIADFSSLTRSGRYFLEISSGRSIEFDIAPEAYDFAFYTSMRSFYLWRCGTAVKGEHNGIVYKQEICHTRDGYLDYLGEKGKRKAGTKGWHDAGDFGKYTVNAGLTLASLFMAWDHFQDKLEKLTLDIPQTTPGLPDFLQELKWETDWLLTMPYPDGSGRISHKLTRVNFSGFIMPEEDDEKRFFTPWSSAATANFAATMAMAARYFEPYDPEYARQCLDAARKSYDFLKANPAYVRFEQGDFKTGGYQSQDADDRLWAAAELWETTGEAQYLEDFEQRLALITDKVEANWDWGDVSNLAMFTYALSGREGRNPHLLGDVRRDIVAVADEIVETGRLDAYGRPLGEIYYWGCNGTVARQAMNLQVAERIAPDGKYLKTALDAVSHLFGRNYYGRSYVTGLGIKPPENPHDRRSGADGIEPPWPGYLIGGGLSAVNWQDVEEDYRTNEIAINWQGALVYALAGFISDH